MVRKPVMPQKIIKGYKALVEEANKLVETISVDQARALLGRTDTVLVDLRDPRKFQLKTHHYVSMALTSLSWLLPVELDPSGLGGELPVDRGLELIAMGLPGGDLAAHGLDIAEAPAQALAHHHVDLDLGHVEPTAVFGRVVPFEALDQLPGFGRRKGLIK